MIFHSYVSLPEGIAENWDFDPVWGYHGDNGEGLSLLSSPWLQSGNSHVPWKIKPDHFPTKEGWSSPHAERTLQKPDSEECPLNDDGMTTAETDKGRYGMIIQMARWPMFCRLHYAISLLARGHRRPRGWASHGKELRLFSYLRFTTIEKTTV